MRTVTLLLMAAVAGTGCAHLQQNSTRATQDTPEAVVRAFLHNESATDTVGNVRPMFLSAHSQIICYGEREGSKSAISMPVDAWVKWAQSESKLWTAVADDIKTILHGDTHATVLVEGHTESWRVDFQMVFILTNENGKWQIISLVQENAQP